MRPRINKKPNTLPESLIVKPMEECVDALYKLGLNEGEIKKLDEVIGAIIDNRLDEALNL